MSRRISQRAREQAAHACALLACNRDMRGDPYSLSRRSDLANSARNAAYREAYPEGREFTSNFDEEWAVHDSEMWALAESMLCTGWEPRR